MDYPVLVFDDDCGFCTWWAEWLSNHSELAIVGFSDLEEPLLDRLPADYENCSHFVTETAVYSCGASIERALEHSDVGHVLGPVLRRLRRIRTYRRLREWGYRRVADSRDVWGRLLSRPPPARDPETRRQGK